MIRDAIRIYAYLRKHKSKTLRMIHLDLKIPEGSVNAACEALYNEGLIEEMNAWIRALPLEPAEKMTKDEFEWFTGTGRFRQ